MGPGKRATDKVENQRNVICCPVIVIQRSSPLGRLEVIYLSSFNSAIQINHSKRETRGQYGNGNLCRSGPLEFNRFGRVKTNHHTGTMLLYVLCLAMEVVNSHQRRALSQRKSDTSGRWFVDAKPIDPETVTHSSLICRFQILCSFIDYFTSNPFSNSLLQYSATLPISHPGQNGSTNHIIDQRTLRCSHASRLRILREVNNGR